METAIRAIVNQSKSYPGSRRDVWRSIAIVNSFGQVIPQFGIWERRAGFHESDKEDRTFLTVAEAKQYALDHFNPF